jgi:hypothetical protein
MRRQRSAPIIPIMTPVITNTPISSPRMAAIGKPSRRMPGIWRRTPRPMLIDILALAISM